MQFKISTLLLVLPSLALGKVCITGHLKPSTGCAHFTGTNYDHTITIVDNGVTVCSGAGTPAPDYSRTNANCIAGYSGQLWKNSGSTGWFGFTYTSPSGSATGTTSLNTPPWSFCQEIDWHYLSGGADANGCF